MSDLIIHRGPDDWGYYTNSKVSLGIRRLSIIDLKSGHQPQHNENEDIWIVFNGEIYNFKDLRTDLEGKGHTFYTKSDTEVIIHSYEEWGEDCVKKLRGQFAFCIYDSRNEILFLARDHLGLKPLYYCFDGDKFIFGSEIKCLLCHNIIREVDNKAFNIYLSLGYVAFNQTLFKGIFKIPASSYLTFDLKKKGFKIKKYWSINFEVNPHKTEQDLANELKKLLAESIKLRLISDVPLGAFLSGGIDSSTVVALMSQFKDDPIKTFSIGFEKGAPTNELKYAKIVSEFFNTDHEEIIIKSTCYDIIPQLVWHFDDLISDLAIIPTYFMSKSAKEKITVALTGDGADEIFAGYAKTYWLYGKKYYRFIPKILVKKLLRFYNNIPFQKLQIILASLNSAIAEEDRYFRPLLRIKDIEKSLITPFKPESVRSQLNNTLISGLDLINQYINYDINYQLPNLYNMKVDKMSMAASLEARIPFLDIKIVEWASQIPTKLKLNGNIEKYILRVVMKNVLPPQILNRKKLGFGTPLNLWLQTGMREISEEILERLEQRKSFLSKIR